MKHDKIDEQSDPRKWVLGELAWNKFCQRYPHFGFSGNQSSWSAFRRRHAQALMEKGVVRRSGRALIAHKDRFDPAAFECVTQAAARANSAATADATTNATA